MIKLTPPKLMDCSGDDPSLNELFIVEGDSAASAVAGWRSLTHQAVLPMQGKPLNAWKANATKVTRYPLFVALADALGMTMIDAEQPQPSLIDVATPLSSLRYQRLVLLFDPDADGMHCGALLLMFLHRWLRPLLWSGRVEMVQAPLFHITYRKAVGGDVLSTTARRVEESLRVCAELTARGATDVHAQHHRGLGSIDGALLSATCIDPNTRSSRIVGAADAQAAIEVFCG
jgi:DNA gyrase subunit B